MFGSAFDNCPDKTRRRCGDGGGRFWGSACGNCALIGNESGSKVDTEQKKLKTGIRRVFASSFCKNVCSRNDQHRLYSDFI